MRRPTPFLLAAVALCAGAADAAAASPYYENFKEYWLGAFKKQNGIVMLVVGLGALSIFIITRSKAKK
jgi:hypothetical protein